MCLCALTFAQPISHPVCYQCRIRVSFHLSTGWDVASQHHGDKPSHHSSRTCNSLLLRSLWNLTRLCAQLRATVSTTTQAPSTSNMSDIVRYTSYGVVGAVCFVVMVLYVVNAIQRAHRRRQVWLHCMTQARFRLVFFIAFTFTFVHASIITGD